ncbi:MAG TPA: hypothetical protein VGE72_17045 [Azospirillum sp.]
MADALHPDDRERDAMWRLHRLEEPTFNDLTHGVFFGLLWLAVLWGPMFVSVLLG